MTPLESTVPSLRIRTARLSTAALGLFLLSLGLLALAGWLSFGEGSGDATGQLPLEVDGPEVAVILAAVAALAAATVAFAALQTAASMRVLARDRRIPPPLPSPVRTLRSLVLAPLGVEGQDVLRPPHWPDAALWPPTAVPERTAVDATVRCTVLIPAHDEATIIGATLTSLRVQTRAPDRVVVIADNCTDDTADIALARGAEVITTAGNTEKKAGALNQVLSELLQTTETRDVVLVMDADSTIARDYLAVGLGLLESDPDLMAVGGLFYGEEGGGLVGQLQRNEFTRYQRYISRNPERVYVLTGTASIFRAFAFQAVAEARGTLIPGTHGQVYDTLALTEDNEMTVALKTLGAKLVSPVECRVTTEVMTSWRSLWRQRLRWHRGALENLGAYGPTRATTIYWVQQMALAYGVIALNSYLLLMTITLLAADTFAISWFWTVVGLVFVFERLVTVWGVGWRGRAIAAPIFIELGYALFLQACFVTSIFQMASGRKAGWNYVPREAAP